MTRIYNASLIVGHEDLARAESRRWRVEDGAAGMARGFPRPGDYDPGGHRPAKG